MLPPPDMHVLTLDNTPVQARPSAIVGLFGTFALAYGAAASMRPRWPAVGKALLALFITEAIQLAYLAHNAGHIASARRVNAPMDRIVIAWGLHNNIYTNAQVTPRQHVGRALGGPTASALTTGSAAVIYGIVQRIPVIGALAEGWLYANAIMLAGALFPSHHFDAGTIVKWTVAGRTGEEALGDEAVQTAGSITIGVLLLATAWFVLRGRWRAAIVAGLAALAGGLDLFVLKGSIPPG